MGNCYGEDSDSEDEYYGYYGKNNRRKPQPPSEPDPHEYKRENEGTKKERQQDGSGYEREGLAHEGDETHEHERLECRTDGTCELGELGELGYKPQHDHNEANGYVHPDHNLS